MFMYTIHRGRYNELGLKMHKRQVLKIRFLRIGSVVEQSKYTIRQYENSTCVTHLNIYIYVILF